MEQENEIPKHPHDHHIAYTLLLVGLICVIFAFMLLSQFLTTVKKHPLPIHRTTNEIIIEDWMTISYITKAYKIPDYVLFESLNVTPKDFKQSLTSLAKRKGLSTKAYIQQTKQIIINYRKSQMEYHQKKP
jgi:hypothetical protein